MNAASSVLHWEELATSPIPTGPQSLCTLPQALLTTLKECGTDLTPRILIVSVRQQRLYELAQLPSPDPNSPDAPRYHIDFCLVASTSRFGIGQIANSNQTPLGLHRIARKIGGEQPVGTIFKGRMPVGMLCDGKTEGAICHRILWLEGLQEGFNRGGNCDTYQRYIYIHGFQDESTLGRPASMGCIHLGATDLVSLYERVPEGTLVWIEE